jgi:hypothetical protein
MHSARCSPGAVETVVTGPFSGGVAKQFALPTQVTPDACFPQEAMGRSSSRRRKGANLGLAMRNGFQAGAPPLDAVGEEHGSETVMGWKSTRWVQRRAKFRKWAFRVIEFGLFQGMVQVLTAVAGLLILRTLSKQEYALFAVTNSMQTACNLLANLGITMGLASIGGRVYQDPHRFGQLLNTARGLRHRFALVSFPFCLPVAAWMLLRNGAGPWVTIALCLAIVLTVVPVLESSIWQASPLMHGEYRRIQKLDLGSAGLRFSLIGMLALTRMNVILAACVAAVSNWTQTIFLKRWAREKIDTTAPRNAEDRRDMLRLSMKSLPNTLFFCFQGQVTLFILTLFGSTTGIADLTALGRVAALFGVFSVVIANVLGPRFTCCQDARRLPRLYLVLVGGSVLVVLPVLGFAWLLPGPFLWMLGAKYAALGDECIWVVAATCIAQIGVVMWNLNFGKAWIRVQAYVFIPVILLTQAICALCLDLRQFHGVLIFNLATAACTIPIYAIDAFLGLRAARNAAPALTVDAARSSV